MKVRFAVSFRVFFLWARACVKPGMTHGKVRGGCLKDGQMVSV